MRTDINDPDLDWLSDIAFCVLVAATSLFGYLEIARDFALWAVTRDRSWADDSPRLAGKILETFQ